MGWLSTSAALVFAVALNRGSTCQGFIGPAPLSSSAAPPRQSPSLAVTAAVPPPSCARSAFPFGMAPALAHMTQSGLPTTSLRAGAEGAGPEGQGGQGGGAEDAAQQQEQQQAGNGQQASTPPPSDATAAADAQQTEVGVDDLLNSPAFLNKKVEVLEKKLETLAAEREEYVVQAAANWEEWGQQIGNLEDEFKLLKGRMLNDTLEVDEDAKIKVVTSVLDVCDNFARANQAIKPKDETEEKIVTYYRAIYDKILGDVFKELGVDGVDTVGVPFDYNMHNAVMRQPSEEHEEDTVMSEMAPGFRMGERVIRPAMVVVSAG